VVRVVSPAVQIQCALLKQRLRPKQERSWSGGSTHPDHGHRQQWPVVFSQFRWET